jgi:hypothetical protein
MIKQNPDSDLKEQDYGKWLKGLTTEALEKESLTLVRRRTVLQNRAPVMEPQKELLQIGVAPAD